MTANNVTVHNDGAVSVDNHALGAHKAVEVAKAAAAKDAKHEHHSDHHSTNDASFDLTRFIDMLLKDGTFTIGNDIMADAKNLLAVFIFNSEFNLF